MSRLLCLIKEGLAVRSIETFLDTVEWWCDSQGLLLGQNSNGNMYEKDEVTRQRVEREKAFEENKTELTQD